MDRLSGNVITRQVPFRVAADAQKITTAEANHECVKHTSASGCYPKGHLILMHKLTSSHGVIFVEM